MPVINVTGSVAVTIDRKNRLPFVASPRREATVRKQLSYEIRTTIPKSGERWQ
jgi:hypothetical protein